MQGDDARTATIVVVDSDQVLVDRITSRLPGVVHVASLVDAGEIVARADVVAIPVCASGAIESDVARVRAEAPGAVVVAFCAPGAEAACLDAMRAGADDAACASRLDVGDLVAAIERAVARRHLALRERRLCALVECGPHGIGLNASGGDVLFASRSTRALLGLRDGDPLENGSRLIHPEDARRLAPLFAELESQPGATRVFELRARHAEGSYRWLEVFATNLLEQPGVEGIASMYVDITRRKGAEDALARSEANFRSLIEKSPDAVLVQREGIVLYANPHFVRLLGLDDRSCLVGHPILDFVHPDELENARQRMRDVVARGQVAPGETRLIRADGAVVHAATDGIIIDFDGAPSTVLFARDVGERRALLARLAVADRLLSVGTLAAGVAHEINNPLAYVTMNLSVLDQELPHLLADEPPSDGRAHLSGADAASLIRDAREGAARVAAIVRDMRTLSRTEDGPSVPVDVRKALQAALKMARGETKHRARVIEQYEAVPLVHGNEMRLGQVFLNLLVNAAHSIPDGHAEANRIVVRTRDLGGGRVGVDVEDTGAGIPLDVQARIFDPFFTTKAIGAGSGLGLSICHGILQSMGGDIRVESTEGMGSVFHVSLPASPGRTEAPGSTPGDGAREGPNPKPPGAVRTARRVLVVDDEPFIGSSLRILLAPEIEVVAVTRAADALAQVDAGERFDAILSDLMMPDMNGMELYGELLKRIPDAARQIIFLTGGAFTASAQEFLGRVRPRCLEKPFDVQTLRSLLREVMPS
jgi:PAS domain S-box-containing protein